MVKPTLSKGKILEEKRVGEYLVKDVFSQKEIIISISGKERMHNSYKKGDVVYFAESSLLPEKGKLMTPIGFKRNFHLASLKTEVDRKYAILKK